MPFESEFQSVEERLCRIVMGLSEKEAISVIARNECISFVRQRDKAHFTPLVGTGHSYRINLTIRNGRVVSTEIG